MLEQVTMHFNYQGITKAQDKQKLARQKRLVGTHVRDSHAVKHHLTTVTRSKVQLHCEALVYVLQSLPITSMEVDSPVWCLSLRFCARFFEVVRRPIDE